MQEWLRIAFSGPVRRRALKVALVVGTVLLAINHGDAILSGNISPVRWLRMILTVVVPYAVSTLSSVGAILDMRKPSALPEKP
ncbi:MAG TPA: nitrate/nitrite transporter NrtS [Thermoanaerobaculia bacterium]|jgi:hypothetical protein